MTTPYVTTTCVLRDPTAETASERRPRCRPPASLDGKTVALLDIGKMRGDEFIDRLEILFNTRGVRTLRYKKPTNTRTAPTAILQDIALKADAVVIALSDCGSCTSCSTHDLADLDGRGIPGVSVITEEFADAFAGQCDAIGFDGAAVIVPHPIQNRTRAELEGFADGFCERILAQICAGPIPGPTSLAA
ncbi:MAG TPA: UGSC family (seleno)protein [Xanthobacteraceae bacterium]|jgi:hypothetical protein|nr:UGSC family (seleno)protein [Xanthobacteraceae bacterium]